MNGRHYIHFKMNCKKRHYNKKEEGLELQLKIWKVGYKEDKIDARKQWRLKKYTYGKKFVNIRIQLVSVPEKLRRAINFDRLEFTPGRCLVETYFKWLTKHNFVDESSFGLK